jgi:hypothetical protein
MVSHLKDIYGFCANVIQEAAMATTGNKKINCKKKKKKNPSSFISLAFGP